MSGSMSRDDLAADLAASLMDAGKVFDGAGNTDFFRHLDIAGEAFAFKRPLVKHETITVVAGTAAYTAASGARGFRALLWADDYRRVMADDDNYAGPEPNVLFVPDAGQWYFRPAPSAAQVSAWGSDCTIRYSAAHTVSATAANTTIPAADRGLFILRAQAEAMRELSMRNLAKPATVREGISGATRNGTPAALFQALLAEFERAP